MARICFLFNHDQTHQIAHSLPIAMAMASQGGHEIVLAVTNSRVERALRDIAGDALARTSLVLLGPRSLSTRLAVNALENLIPARKLLVYRDNLDFFASLDALVVPEKTSLLLKRRYGLERLKIIHTRHGAGDRAIGFIPEPVNFDLTLVMGEKYARRAADEAGLDPKTIRIIGYPKFDLFAGNRPDLGFADTSRPVVLYNPHPSPRLSSWYTMGEAVLEAFARSDRFNFIFAPHVMMFARKYTVSINPPAVRRTRPPERRLFQAAHMLFDAGSRASIDMSYTNAADLYIGDVSSQVYEYLIRPRPCLFLNAHGADWRRNPNYGHWRAGPVVGPGEDILGAAEKAIQTHSERLSIQRELFADTFSVTDEPAAQRGARAIAEFLRDG